MLRSRTLHHLMARLSLLAALLLLLLPTAGRLAEHRVGVLEASWVAICTMSGLKYVALSGGDRPQSPVAPVPSDPHPDADCAYCPLLASIVVLALWLALAIAPASPWVRLPPPGVVRRKQLHPCGLGSRGPPLPL